MNKLAHAVIFGLFLSTTPVLAQSTHSNDETAEASAKFSLVGGLTYGGEKLAGLEYEDGSTNNIKAGEFGYLGMGVEVDVNESFLIKFNGNYHWAIASAKNGDMTFSRLEWEAIPYYRLNENFRIGLGLGLHTNVKFSSDFSLDASFDNATAIIGSVGYQFENSDNWVEFRAVSVNYSLNKIDNYSLDGYDIPETDGNHIGIAYHWVF